MTLLLNIEEPEFQNGVKSLLHVKYLPGLVLCRISLRDRVA